MQEKEGGKGDGKGKGRREKWYENILITSFVSSITIDEGRRAPSEHPFVPTI